MQKNLTSLTTQKCVSLCQSNNGQNHLAVSLKQSHGLVQRKNPPKSRLEAWLSWISCSIPQMDMVLKVAINSFRVSDIFSTRALGVVTCNDVTSLRRAEGCDG